MAEDNDRDTDRLEFFSDAVIAIAATLLVIEIKVPQVEDAATGATLSSALSGQWASYLGFVMSFLFIGIGWANHHDMFRHIKRVDHALLILNLLFLMCIALVPFSTALFAEYVGKEGGRTAALVYTGTLIAVSIFYNAVWLYATRNHRLVDENVNPRLLHTMTKEYALSLLFYLTGFGLAFFHPLLV